jgi:hypothetical protein
VHLELNRVQRTEQLDLADVSHRSEANDLSAQLTQAAGEHDVV